MPKLFQCANCRKTLLGGTYTLIKHFEKCILEKPPNNTVIIKTKKNTIKYNGNH